MERLGKIVRWLVYPRHTTGEVFVVLVLSIISVFANPVWANTLSKVIVSAVLFAGLLFVGKVLFSRSRAKPDVLTMRSIQFIGMALIMIMMVSHFGWFQVKSFDYSLDSFGKTITVVYGLLISFRAIVGMIFIAFVIFGQKLSGRMAMTGLLYFYYLPDVKLLRMHRLVYIAASVFAVWMYHVTNSFPEAFIYSALALQAFNVTHEVKKEWGGKSRKR